VKSRLSASEIAKDICQGAVYYFADKDLLSKEPHYFGIRYKKRGLFCPLSLVFMRL